VLQAIASLNQYTLVVHDYPTTWENLKQLTQETNSAKQDPWL